MKSNSFAVEPEALHQGLIDGKTLSVGHHRFDLGSTQSKGIHNAMNALFAIKGPSKWG
ncbi:MAG: hypothetical protein IPN33_26765 [Saprospiraceae bacterium]|nr:hypothetical protein [Saprospiraceae bacterium]